MKILLIYSFVEPCDCPECKNGYICYILPTYFMCVSLVHVKKVYSIFKKFLLVLLEFHTMHFNYIFLFLFGSKVFEISPYPQPFDCLVSLFACLNSFFGYFSLEENIRFT